MHDWHKVNVLMAVNVKRSVSATELAEASNLSLNLLVELMADAPSPRVHGR